MDATRKNGANGGRDAGSGDLGGSDQAHQSISSPAVVNPFLNDEGSASDSEADPEEQGEEK